MVEMLGVLAIMGLVGMVGVKMYTSAMNKHKANELIYEAQKRATMVAMQITVGQENLSITDFTNPTGYTFGVEKNPNNANQFNITITGIDSDVCTQVKTAIGNGSVIRHIDDGCTELTFNNDLSRIEYPSDYDTDQVECTGNGYKWCRYGDNGSGSKCVSSGSDCCAGIVYDMQCQNCASSSGGLSNKSASTPCDFDGDGIDDSHCNTGVCPSPNVINGATCTSNADCGGMGSGYYCKIDYDASTNLKGTLSNLNADCYQNLKGTCAVITVPRLTLIQKSVLVKSGFKSTITECPYKNWWSAKNWCEAQGLHLIDVSEIDCYRASNSTLVEAGSTDMPFCCKQGQTCQQSSLDTSLWSGKTVLAGKEQEVSKFSDKLIGLRKAFGSTGFWTVSPFKNNSDNTCNAFIANSMHGLANTVVRYSDMYALCE